MLKVLQLLSTMVLIVSFLAACRGVAPPTATPSPSATPLPATPTPTVTPILSPATMLPDSAHILSEVEADLDGNGTVEWVVLAGFGQVPDSMGFDKLQLFVIRPEQPEAAWIAWQSGTLVGDRGEPLRTQDLDGDGKPEVLSAQSMGAAGHTLYVLTWDGQRYGFLRAHGGNFDGQDHFGQNGVRVHDMDGDGVPEILASFGPAASWQDIYQWNGRQYAFVETLQPMGK